MAGEDKAKCSTLVAFLREQARTLSDPEDWHGPGVGIPSGRMEWQAADLIESLSASSAIACQDSEWMRCATCGSYCRADALGYRVCDGDPVTGDRNCKMEPCADPNARRDGHSARRVKDGKLETFDPHPESATTPPTSERSEADEDALKAAQNVVGLGNWLDHEVRAMASFVLNHYTRSASERKELPARRGFLPGADPGKCVWCGVKIEQHGDVCGSNIQTRPVDMDKA